MVVSFGEVIDHPDDETSAISDTWEKHPDDKASGMSSARGEYPGDEASGMGGARAFLGRLAFGPGLMRALGSID